MELLIIGVLLLVCLVLTPFLIANLIWLMVSLVIGGLIGLFAGMLTGTRKQMSTLGMILIGIVGAWMGQFLAGMVGLVALGMLGHLVVSVLGAVVLVAVLKVLDVMK